MLQEKAALHAERKTHGVDLDGVRFSRMVDAERAATIERARRATNAETETCVESPAAADTADTADTAEAHDHVSFTNKRVAVLVRVRPLSTAERAARAVDVVTCVPSTRGSPALAAVHEPRTKVDGTRHVESSRFDLDGAFDARASDADVYAAAIEPLVRLCLEGDATPADAASAARFSARRGDDAAGANATVFAYGQTGSGKTHTMTGCTSLLARDVCLGAREKNLRVEVSHYEVYGGKCFDLLADRARVRALEDARGRVRVVGLTERLVREPHEMLALAEKGAACRKTSRTDANASSSRSHAVFQIALRSDADHAETRGSAPRNEGLVAARLSLVDLAGSERGADRGKAVSERIRREGAEINTSLLALKECIRALSAEKSEKSAEPPPGDASARVPFRGSKLTTVLRDAFVGKRSRTVLLAHISPGHDSAEHTVNTLRYATRLKDFLKDEPRLGATERATGTEKRATGKERATGKDPSAAAPLRERDENAAFDDTRHERGLTSDERPSSASSDPDSPKERSEETREVFSSGSASRLALAEKRRVAFESGVALLEAHRVLARASEAEAGALESAERALAAVDRDAVDLEGEGDDESALDNFRAACDALAATLDGRAALERRARQAAARAHAARAEEQAAANAAGALRGGG